MSPRILALLAALVTACGKSDRKSEGGDVAAAAASETGNETSNRELSAATAANEVLRAAQAAVDSEHPWHATQRLAPVLAKNRTPAATLIAARAAAGWGGWTEVARLLTSQPWVDTQFAGEGRELLARSALERDDNSAALRETAAALRLAQDDESRGVRLVLHARALERNNQFDSAAVAYAKGAELLRPVRDWLSLRAAGSQRDSMQRNKTLSSVSLASAKPRVGWTDAQARERFGDNLGAAARYASLGSVVPALRLRLAATTDPATKEELKEKLISIVRTESGTSEARNAVDVLDKVFPTLAPTEELIVARSAATSGPPSRAITGFGRASAASLPLTPTDRLAYAQSYVRLGRWRDALAQLAMVQGPLAGQAAYQKARVLLTSSTNDATRAALRDVVTRYPKDVDAASSALYLLADLETDEGDDVQAQSLFNRVYTSYPTSSRAGSARFQSAVISYASGDARTAALKFDSLLAILPRADDALAARYWSGRAWADVGDKAKATARWREVIAQQPTSYYAVLSGRRLGEALTSPESKSDRVRRVSEVDDGIERAALLERLGMDTEAGFEYNALDDAAPESVDRALATANAFVAHGQASRAIRIAQGLAEAGHRDMRVYRVLFPIVDSAELTRAARAQGLDPALVAGLVRQESSFDPRAISVANARGLMQLLPNVGAEVSRSLKFPVWNQALLFDPDANLQLGTAHLASYMKQYGVLPRVLAAYNAGGSRVSRWSIKAGMDDPEVFAERIPFVETRDYVRLVQRNREVYNWLLGTGPDARR